MRAPTSFEGLFRPMRSASLEGTGESNRKEVLKLPCARRVLRFLWLRKTMGLRRNYELCWKRKRTVRRLLGGLPEATLEKFDAFSSTPRRVTSTRLQKSKTRRSFGARLPVAMVMAPRFV
jgi:hypothetical protein